MKIDLLKFVSYDETRPHILKPFDRDTWTCASDGAILIRVPRVYGIEKCDGPSKAEYVAKILACCDRDASAAEPLPQPEGRWKKQCCPDCWERDEIFQHCDECNGSGVVESWDGCPVDFHGIELSGQYLHLICAELPNAKIFPLTNIDIGFSYDGTAVGIVFDGGRGVLMGMRNGCIKEWKEKHAS